MMTSQQAEQVSRSLSLEWSGPRTDTNPLCELNLEAGSSEGHHLPEVWFS
jgi:hypothetical protein